MERAAPAGEGHYSQIDALKGIAIFLVVLGHSIILYPVDLHQNGICEFIFRWLSSVHMPLFFVISGFCFSYQGGYRKYIWKKVKRLLVPYLVFNALDVVPRYLFPSLVNRPRGIGESVQKIIFDGGEYWFLYVLFIIFLIYPLIDKLTANSMLFAAALPALLLLHYAGPSIPVFKLNAVVQYLFYFMIGVLVKRCFGAAIFELELDKRKLAAAIGALSALWLVLLKLGMPWLNIPMALLGVLVFYLCAQYGMVVGIFQRFGRYSLQIYLFNGFLLVISRTVIVSVLEVSNPFIIIAFNMLVDFFLSYIVIKYICERIKPAKILMGMA